MTAHERGGERAQEALDLGALPWLTFALVSLAALVHFGLPSPRALAYTPAAPSLLRLLGCHLAHFSDHHFVWDAFSFAALGSLSERVQRARYALFLLASALVVPPLACALEPWVEYYAGLSGLVIGQVALALATVLQRALAQRRTRACMWTAGLLALLFVKQLYEYRIGDTSLITMRYEGFATVPGAHLVSAVVGTLVGLVPPVRTARATRRPAASVRPRARFAASG